MNNMSRRLRAVTGEEEKLAASSSNTKLYAEDYEEVQSQCVGGVTESARIRELVRSGLQRERYRKAASDPAVRELLRTFQEMIDRSLAEAEGRLMALIQTESALKLNHLACIYPLVTFAAEALTHLPADTAPDELREEAWEHYNGLYDQHQEEGRQFTARQVGRRNEAAKNIRGARPVVSSPPPAAEAPPAGPGQE